MKKNLQTETTGEDFQNALKEAIRRKKASENEFTLALRIQAASLKAHAEKLEKVANLIEILSPDQQKLVHLSGNDQKLVIEGPEALHADPEKPKHHLT